VVPKVEKQVDYEEMRRKLLRNYENLCDNLDSNLADYGAIQNDIQDYVEKTYEYKQNY